MNYYWELFINIMESFLFLIFVNHKLIKKNIDHFFLKQLLITFFLAIVVFLLNISDISPIITMLTLLALYYIYTCIFFSSSHIINLFWVVVFCIASISADATMTIIPTNLLHINLSAVLIGGYLRIPFTLLYIASLGTIILIFLCFSSKTFKLSISEKFIFIFLSILCIVIEDLIVVGQTKVYSHNPNFYMALLYIVFFLVLILFIALIIYVYHLGLEKEKNLQLLNQHILSEMERKQYEQIISSISELRYLKHDISNHLETLNSLMNNNAYTEAQKFIQNLSATVNQNHYILSSGNPIIDSIITNKLIQCKTAQIRVEYSIFLTDSIPLSNIELCSLIGNLFDNAIEASQKITEPDIRFIEFKIKPFQDMLSIFISNQTNGKYKINRNKEFLSLKDDNYNPYHGLGISRISKIVHTHHGILDITPAENKFTVFILLPLN